MERFKNMVEPSLFTYTCRTRNRSTHKFAALLRWQPQYYLKFTAPPCFPALKNLPSAAKGALDNTTSVFLSRS